jgi:hypothetical protein
MRTMLREGPARTPHEPVTVVEVERRRRGGRRGGGAVMLVVGIVGGLLLAGGLGDLLPDFLNPFKTERVDRSQPALLEALSDLNRFEAASAQFQIPIDIEDDVRLLPGFVAGERTTFLAVGNVDASVDFGSIGPDTVIVTGDGGDEGGSVSITLPPAELGEARIDPDASSTLDRDRGIINRLAGVFSDNPSSDREMFQLAEQKLEQAARESELLQRAEQNTRAMLETLVTSLGFDRVTVTFVDPTAAR